MCGGLMCPPPGRGSPKGFKRSQSVGQRGADVADIIAQELERGGCGLTEYHTW